MIKRLLPGLALVFALRPCLAQNPSITDTIPSAVAPGRTTRLTFLGDRLQGATGLWTSFGEQATFIAPDPTNPAGPVMFDVVVPKSVPVGIAALRLAGTNGISDLHLFMIDDLPVVAEGATNRAPGSAQRVSPPVAVEGHCEELAYDYFRFKARKGQPLTIEVVANRLGSPLDPVLRVLDAAGNELAYCDDDPAAGSDARLRFIAPATGEYLVELRDVGYQGGRKYRYRLRLGDFPLAGSTYPAGLRRGERARVQFLGRAVQGLRPADVPAISNAASVRLNPRFGARRGSGFVTMITGELPEVLEHEPDDTPETATRLLPPCLVNGRFGKARDRDWFEFAVEPGQKLVFTGRTRSLGSPCDLYMQLYGPDGKAMAEADITGANEGTLTNTFKAAGVFRLMVEELNRAGGPDLVYRVALEPLGPGFTLAAETNRVDATAGGTFEIKVSAARRDYDGPIALSLADPGSGFTLEDAVIPEKKAEITLKVKVPANLQPGSQLTFSIVGRARIADADFETRADTLGAMKRQWPLLRYPPEELDGWIGLGIKSGPAQAGKEAARRE